LNLIQAVPVLIVDEIREIAQSIAILSYIEKLIGLDLSDPISIAKAGEFFK
jgi:glutathione S-transferase